MHQMRSRLPQKRIIPTKFTRKMYHQDTTRILDDVTHRTLTAQLPSASDSVLRRALSCTKWYTEAKPITTTTSLGSRQACTLASPAKSIKIDTNLIWQTNTSTDMAQEAPRPTHLEMLMIQRRSRTASRTPPSAMCREKN